MNKPMKHGYWGNTVDYREILAKIAEIGPQLEANAPADEAAGELTPESFELLRPLRMSHLLATEKLGGARPYYAPARGVRAGADVVVRDGMQGGTAATQDVFIEQVGMPILACIPLAVKALQDLGMHRKVQLIVSGGIRTGADVAKAMAMGADAVAIGTAALVALGDNDPKLEAEYQKLQTTADAYDDWHEGKDPAGITTQDPELFKRFDPVLGGRRLKNYLKVMTLEAQTIARACGKNHLHNLEPEDLVALNVEAAAMAGVPLAGTTWIPGRNGGF